MQTLPTTTMSASADKSQDYCLRWNNHHSTLVSVLNLLYQQSSFVDVTLTSDGKSLTVHRLVLCACSSYFQELLSQHWDKQAIIYLKDVPFSHLKALVDYMYKGEVNVTQDQISSFLQTAESLRIKGLTNSERESHEMVAVKRHSLTAESDNAKRSRKTSGNSHESVDSMHHVTLQQCQVVTPIASVDATVSAEGMPQPINTLIVPSVTSLTTVLPLMETSLHQPTYATPTPMIVPPTSCPQVVPNNNMSIVRHDIQSENYVVVEPKLETEHEGEVSGVSGDDEEWSDSDLTPTPNQQTQNSYTHVQWNEAMAGASGPSGTQNQGSAFVPPQVNAAHIHAPTREGIPLLCAGNSRRSPRPASASAVQDKPYVCTRCGRSYSRRGALIQHQRYECGVEPQFSCPMCPYKIKRKDSLNRHIRNMHHNQTS